MSRANLYVGYLFGVIAATSCDKIPSTGSSIDFFVRCGIFILFLLLAELSIKSGGGKL